MKSVHDLVKHSLPARGLSASGGLSCFISKGLIVGIMLALARSAGLRLRRVHNILESLDSRLRGNDK